ncbi:radial spoke head protein 6 homolog A-like, partial [Carlito syrichta]|uniref:Radial spoke head protein 6 homolog A-like n=1 Tax=Carlito syrichta TaxID=1868482 RepID=A0A1U7T1Q2_CARSF
MWTSQTNPGGWSQRGSQPQQGFLRMPQAFQAEEAQMGGLGHPPMNMGFPSEGESGIQANNPPASLMVQQLQQNQGSLFQQLESTYQNSLANPLGQFNVYHREGQQFYQGTQHGPYLRDDPALHFSPSELGFLPYNTELPESEPRELAVQNAKAYLLQTSISCDLSLYEHLVNLLTKILNQRPEDPLSILEVLNRTTQWEWFHPKLDTLRDDPEMQPTYEMAEKQKALFSRGGGGMEGEQEMEEEV